MVEIASAAPETLRAKFTQHARLPEGYLARAERFAEKLAGQIESGQPVSPKDQKRGAQLAQSLENRAEIYGFSAAVLAGQEVDSESDLDRMIADISAGVERAETAVQRLRGALTRV